MTADKFFNRLLWLLGIATATICIVLFLTACVHVNKSLNVTFVDKGEGTMLETANINQTAANTSETDARLEDLIDAEAEVSLVP